MRKAILIFATVIAVSPAFASDGYFSEKVGCFVIVPPGWNLDSTVADEIILTDSVNSAMYISIKRYPIAPESQIGSEKDLAVAIEGLYNQLGVNLPPEQKPKFSVKSGKAQFEAEFMSRNTDGIITAHKFMKGIIARQAGKGQVLYLMIGASPIENFAEVYPQLKIISSSFYISEELDPVLYVSKGSGVLKYFLFILLVMLSIFFFTRNRRIQKSPNPLGSDSSSFWRCINCGRVNHNDSRICHRCGTERQVIKIPGASNRS